MYRLLVSVLRCMGLVSLVLVGGHLSAGAANMIVADGQARGEIVIAEDAGRTVRLAAQELQDSVEKMSGARLPILFGPSGAAEVVLYVGASEATERLGVTAKGLSDGAWRIASGDDWMVFIGDDTLFEPREPWARNNGQIASGWLQEQWQEASGGNWGVPNSGMYKNQWRRIPADMGLPEGVEVDPRETLTIWAFDEHGSFNAVCGWLYSLGMRWYMPGEIGEVVPQLRSIPLTPVNETVFPDFSLRRFNVRYSVVGEDTSRWAMRLGLRDPNEIQVAHGMATMTKRQEVFDRHPEWFAEYNGKRSFNPHGNNQLCYSNEELLEETVRYARAQFDVYGFDAVSIMPPDGYTRMCECSLCEGKESPELGTNGVHSNHIWGFVNEVARRVAETHPDKLIINCAYNRYRQPPSDVDKLEPNVRVVLVGGRRPMSNRPDQIDYHREWRDAWYAKTDHPIMIFENYPFTGRGTYMPMFTATSIGESINSTKGRSDGEDIWMSIGRDFATRDIGYNHFPAYFTARMYWGGADKDIRPLVEEYCALFYGPAGDRMLAFFDYCEANWQRMGSEQDVAEQALKLFDAALAAAPQESIYARRLALVDDYLSALRSKSEQLGRVRGPIPTLRMVYNWRGPIKIDGILDEDEWVNNPAASTVSLREMQAGGVPTFGTTVKAVWVRNSLYLAIRCNEPAGHPLNVTTDQKNDPAILDGDAVRVLIETDSRSFYEIVVNPAAAVIDFDHSASEETAARWSSEVKVATHIADDHWTIEMELPITNDENDPLHQVIGRKPTVSLPWFINIVRQRVRDDGVEFSAFSPTGSESPHDPMRFGRLYDGRSSAYNAAEPEYDFIQAMRKAANLARGGDNRQAVTVLVEQAEDDVSDFQRSLALAEAVRQAHAADDPVLAESLFAEIPIQAVAASLKMERLLAQRDAAAVVSRFGDADIAAWPFWQRGEGYRLRAAARAATGDHKGAAEDYRNAVIWIGDWRQRAQTHLALANLLSRDPAAVDEALALYKAVIDSASRISNPDQFAALIELARLESARGNHADAIGMIETAEPNNIGSPIWRGRILMALADSLNADGRQADARAVYRTVAADEAVPRPIREQANSLLAD